MTKLTKNKRTTEEGDHQQNSISSTSSRSKAITRATASSEEQKTPIDNLARPHLGLPILKRNRTHVPANKPS
jgi:hypothetical protein